MLFGDRFKKYPDLKNIKNLEEISKFFYENMALRIMPIINERTASPMVR